MLRNISKIIFITLVLLNISLSGDNKNTLLNFKVKLDNSFRQTLNMDPNLYKIWIGTTDGSEEIEEPLTKSGQTKTYIPGLPGSAPLVEEVYSTSKVSTVFNYIIHIYIDDVYNKPYMINRIKGEVLQVWPAFGQGNRLEKNVEIKVLSFQAPEGSEEEDTELQKLEQKQRDLEKSLSDFEKKYSDQENKLQEKQIELEQKQAEIDAEKAQNQEAAKTLETQILELTKEIESEKELKKSKELENTLKILNQELDDVRSELQEEKDVKNAQTVQVEELLNSIDELAKAQQLEQMDKQAAEIEELKNTLLQSERNFDENLQFRLEYLEQQFKHTQQFKDSLLNRMGQRLDEINYPTNEEESERIAEIEATAKAVQALKALEEKDSAEPDSSSVVGSKEASESKEESSNGAGWVLWLAIGLLGLLIILSLVAIVTNKKKVIYLKPKNKNSKGSGDGIENNNQINTPGQNNAQAPPVVASPVTSAPIDEGVMQSEIRTQRQSAVAMSAGQKEGATQIVKDWLEESKNEENSEE